MSEANINLSPDALLAGIETVAKAIGRTCQMDVVVAMARAEAKASPAASDEVLASAMTLRDYFAGQAMARIVAADKDGCMGPDITAQASYRLADRMLAARGVA